MNPRDNEENLHSPKTMRPYCKQRIFFDVSLQFGTQVHPHATSKDAKAAVDKEWKELETIPAWDSGKVKSKKEGFLEAQRDTKKVHFATTHGHVSPQKIRSWNPNYKSKKAESCSVVTLLKTTLWPMQSLLSRARLRPR